jgi:hypothetical protein
MSESVGHIDPSNKKIALLISILALVLAFSETLGKAAQTAALSDNVEASNLWTFFQAKTIRLTVLRTAAEALEAATGAKADDAVKSQIDSWRKTVARYDSEPETKEGRKELAERAKQAEAERDRAMAAYHHYEVGSAAEQIGIVLASAAIITGYGLLAWFAGALGVLGVIFSLIAFFAPMAVHLF